jgi:nucleoid DNA-binding protein
MVKILNADIAKIVAKKRKITDKNAESFLVDMFDVIHEGLHADKQVKVKGLGTFKITAVKSRESVNVNTGERVVIEGHSKVSFTPETSMKERVNKPFAQFETVMVNDHVDVAKLEAVEDVTPDKEETVAEEVPVKAEKPTEEKTVRQEETVTVNASVEEEKVAPKENAVTVKASVEEEKVAKEEVSKEKEQVVGQKIVQEQKAEVPKTASLSSAAVETPEAESDGESNGSKKWIWICLLCVACIAVACYFGRGLFTHSESKDVKAPVAVADTIAKDSIAPSQKANEPDFDKMNADPRLKYCAYDIVGIDTVVTLGEHQTMQSYCNATLGKQMIIYFQVLNDTTELGGGATMKVPKVKVRKR